MEFYKYRYLELCGYNALDLSLFRLHQYQVNNEVSLNQERKSRAREK